MAVVELTQVAAAECASLNPPYNFAPENGLAAHRDR